IVWDFIKYAKDHNIPVGPGRGSAAGSVVSYCLRITNIDPVRFGLIFERFLNPERVSMPDIDVDFCNEDRQKVIDYVVEKYGRDCVSQIITFNKMKAKNAIRDVGRVLDISYGDTDAIAKMIPFDLKMTIEKALMLNPELKEKYDSDATVRELIDDAMALEGLIRNAGTHAAGVVISQKPLTEYVPLQKNDDVLITQFPKDTVEELGLLKMDFLGLRNLGIIKDAIGIIKESTGEDIDIDNINLNEESVYKMISRGETEGVFQLESPGMKQFIKEMKPENIEDIVAGISLYRPGPMDQIPRYIKNKNNPEKVVYKHPLLEPILNVTYGCMVYQEQVMEIVRRLGGYSLARADLVRRAMSKKKMDVMNEERKNFIYGKMREDGTTEIEGCLRRGVDEATANEIFDEMMEFANYAFNKSHAAAYAFVVYQTAYLKHFYPAQYMAALLSSVLDSPEKVGSYSVETTRMGIRILPPDINESAAGFTVSGSDIRFGLAVIKNVGVGCIEAVVKERKEHGKFTSYRDFAKRTMSLGVTKRVHEYLIKAGAFDALGEKRACLLADFEGIIDSFADDLKRNVEGQMSLWGEEQTVEIYSANLPEFPQKELLKLEKESIGYYISGHPLNEFSNEIAKLSTISFAELQTDSSEEGEMAYASGKTLSDGDKVKVCAIATGIKTKITKNSKMMAFVTAEDLSGQAEILVFPNVYERCKQYLVEDMPIVISGKLSFREDEEPKILCDDISPLEHGARVAQSGEKLYMKFPIGKDYLLEDAKKVLAQHTGDIPVYIFMEEKKMTAIAPKHLWCNGSEDALASLKTLLGDENIIIK
ncbi:MAG: DNA polymerase III subunit alpha, partial [Clostridia bacterium]|nr:DNA polymerase III subunit alpha [Clostridia bacterium]